MDQPIVMTASGTVRGTTDGGVSIYKGIPYAAPPTGDRRFKPPMPVAAWTGVRDALDYGPSCPQRSSRPAGWSQEPGLDEDCLYLNVWTSAASASTKRPVMVWLHGGGFSIGSGSWPVYDGAALAHRGDVVVVTINHRLGIFGYLHLGELAGPDYATSGNAGMLDLVAALEWVRDNIAQFGGDPDNVTIFGESGGGAKVSTLLAMPGAAGLFHRGVIQSGPSARVRRQEAATESARQVLAGIDVDPTDTEALAALSTEELLEAMGKRGRMSFGDFSPVLDGIAITNHPGAALAEGTAHDVPLIIGCNRDEASLFLAMNPKNADLRALDDAGLTARASAAYGDDAPHVLDAYRAARPDDAPYDLYIAMESDRMMRAPSIDLAERKIEGKGTSVFMYLFTWAAGPLGSAHGYEIAFVFDNAREPQMHESPRRTALAAAMSDAWIAFARNGDPSSGDNSWPAYDVTDRSTMIFDGDGARVVPDPAPEGRRAWKGTAISVGMIA